MPAESTPLGICRIDLPHRSPKGTPVEVTYSYNSNQVLEVVVQAAGRESRAEIDRNAGLSAQELRRAAADLCKLRVF